MFLVNTVEPASVLRPSTVSPGEAGAGLSSGPRLRPWRGLETTEDRGWHTVQNVYIECTPVQCTGATRRSSVTSPGVSGDSETMLDNNN